MEYRIVSAKDVDTLEDRIHEYISMGFEPKGGVAVAMVGESKHQIQSIQILQAMVKK